MGSITSFVTEAAYWQQDLIVCGIDEVGMGALAGPVVAGAVIFSADVAPLIRGERGVKFVPYEAEAAQRAKQLRFNQTEPKKKLWHHVLSKKQLGYKFLRKKPLLHYIVDFYCAELGLVIEVDGDSHDEQRVYDSHRERELKEKFNIITVRYENRDIINNLEGVVIDLQTQIEARVKTLSRPPLSGRVVIRDSKTLSLKQRETAATWIKNHAIAWAVGEATVAEIDASNIRVASHLAMERAVNQLTSKPDLLLIDGTPAQPHPDIFAQNIVGGDAIIFSIAAASIIAKVHRDQIMCELAQLYPQYGFAGNKGYGSAAHLAALRAYGPIPAHRTSYAPVAAAMLRT